jgi:DNA helicase II / ATP-dependent DNA helicase PcrA
VQEGATSEDLLDGLTSSQRAAVTSESAPLCILASAGAGKTRVLTRRIAYRARRGSADAAHTVAVTFTRKAAGELQHRLRQLGLREQVTAGTFHSLASAQLHRWWSDRGQQPPVLLERKARLLAPLAGSRRGLAQAPVAELAGHMEWARARLIGPDRFEAAVHSERRSLPPGVTPGDLAGLYNRYEHEKRRRGLIDFDDLLSLCADALERDPEFAGAQRWRWRHVYVDEFQDLNALQHRLLLAWLGPSRDLFVVGDPQQAIYGWNGADPDLLTQVPRRWPGTEVIHLDANHRCTRQIVAAAASVLGPAGGRLHSAGREGPEPRVQAYPSETAEATGIAAEVRRGYEDGRAWGSMAVLTRTNAQLIPIQKALSSAGIPFWAPARAALLDDSVVRRVLQEMRGDQGRPLQAAAADLAAQADEDLRPEAISGENRSDDDAGRAALTALAELARSFAGQEPGTTVGRWLAWLPSALRDGSDGASRSGAVTVCTFHRAKGLEWDAVWVAGLEQGLVPIGRTGSPGAEAEEKRLLYVALTRAASDLRCSWARQRTFGTRPVPRDPSPWLDLIAGPGGSGGGRGAGPRGASSQQWRERIEQQRRGLREKSKSARRPIRSKLPEGWGDPDPDLVSSLRAWRLETARTSGVPAYVVLHDVTLEALAALRPTTVEQLLAVPGLGPVKAARYGPSLLSLLTDRVVSA